MEKVRQERNGRVVIGLWVNKEIQESLNNIAKKKELTFSDIVRTALREYVEKHANK